MGFSLPSLPAIPVPIPDISGAIGKLTKTFDPSNMVGQMSGNVMSQQGAIEAMRSQLDSIRADAQAAIADVDFTSVKKYTTGMAQMTDAACVMASTKPALTPMTAGTLTNPLATNVLSSISGQLTGDSFLTSLLSDTNTVSNVIGTAVGVDPTLINVALTGDVAELTSPNTIASLGVTAAGLYVSGVTGGIIPPSVAGEIIQTVSSAAVNSGIPGTMMHGVLDVVSNATGIKPLLGMPEVNLGQKAIGADPTGNLFANAVSQVTSGTINKLSTKALEKLDSPALTQLVTDRIDKLGGSKYGPNFGGINTVDPTSGVAATAMSGLDRATKEGNLTVLDNMANTLVEKDYPSKLIQPYVENVASTITENPGNISEYKTLFDKYVPNTTNTSVANNLSVNDLTSAASQQPFNIQKVIHGNDTAKKYKSLREIANNIKKNATTAIGNTTKDYLDSVLAN